jgi:CRISPR-associated endonuclease/helicase Cas3
LEIKLYYAHSLPGSFCQSEWQTLKDHLKDTANLSGDFAEKFGAKDAAFLAGALHDLGKYSEKFQQRLKGGEKVDHSTAGAVTVARLVTDGNDAIIAELLSYCIAGHHAGLADKIDLIARLDKSIEQIDPIWREEIITTNVGLWPKKFVPSRNRAVAAFQIGFLGRMLFSCLVDADYKDTEKFYNNQKQLKADRIWPELNNNIDMLIVKFNDYMADKQRIAPRSDINSIRADILSAVRANSEQTTGLFTLTVPTGGGKTLASLAFALDHAKAHSMRRIVYAIPFTSIIDQTAKIFREVLGENYILEHHSSIDDQTFREREQRDKLRLAMEDWAAPVVITTNVQLFESLFANRPSRCRKLHNLTRSVIILDEAQTLPHGLLRPCMAALEELTRHYGCTIILCTATQPALDKRSFTQGSGLELEGRELAPNPSELSRKLQRVLISRCGELDDDQLLNALSQHHQVLTIVNGRRHAVDLYNKACVAGLEGVVHLTTRQYAYDRRLILDQIREKLRAKEPCHLIATSLIEAGVDVDFPRVWRAEAGLDQIIQAAGRCNREGKRTLAESIVTIFKPKNHKPPLEIQQLADDFSRMANMHSDLLSPEAIHAYFKEVFWRKGPAQLDIKKILNQFGISAGELHINYKTVAHDFKFIESGMTPIVIGGSQQVDSILALLNNSEASPGKAARELQGYCVQVPPKDATCLISNHRAHYWRPDLWGNQFLVLSDLSLYRPEVGLIWEDAEVLGDMVF